MKGKQDMTREKKEKIYLHIRIKNAIRQFHYAYRPLGECEVKQVPDEFWINDLPKIKSINFYD